jgi:hypothetical protein
MARRTIARRVASKTLVVAVAALVVATSCGRADRLGGEEAVEILVLDGIARRQAECVVSDLEDRLELEKITGLDTDLSDRELAVLSASSAACAPVSPEVGGVAVDDPGEDLLLAAPIVDIDEIVVGLVRGGLEAEIAACVGEQIEASPDSSTAATDDRFLSDSILVCDVR